MTFAGRVFRMPGLQGVSNLHTSSRMHMGFGSHGSDNDPDVLHKEKERNLSGAFQCILCIARSSLPFALAPCRANAMPYSSAYILTDVSRCTRRIFVSPGASLAGHVC